MEDARQTAYVMGMPDLALVEMPRGLTNLRPDEIIGIARSVRENIVSGLTQDTDAPGREAQILPNEAPYTFSYTAPGELDAWELFHEDFTHVRGLGDGFPMVPPTADRVAAMLRATDLDAGSQVAVMPPGLGSATVEKIAVNSVMAGCKPEHLPVVMAAVEAFADPTFNPRGVAMSTGPHAPMIIVNGPIVERLGINGGRGALGPGRQSAANTAIGRALRLVMMNVGFAYLGIFDLDVIGTPRKYSMCLAENVRASPWEPISVEHGLRDDESAVTLIGVESACEIQDMTNDTAEGLLRTFAGTAPMSGAASVQATYIPTQAFGMHNMLLIAPEHAALLASEGWDKQRIREFMYEQTKRPKRWVLNAVEPRIIRPEAQWVLECSDDDLIPIVRAVDYFDIVVAGGAGGKSQYHTAIGFPVTRSVEPYLPRV
jgi:hypothetical protein